MKAATIKEIKNELELLSQPELVNLCTRLARFKLENKELLTYLVFEANNEAGYVSSIKETLHPLFTEVNVKSLYIAKKNLRKILRLANRYIKYSGETETEVQVLIYILEEIKMLGIDLTKSQQIMNIYTTLLKRVHKNIMLLHEDLQFEYLREWEKAR